MKRITVLVLIAALILTMAGCTQASSSSEASKASSESQSSAESVASKDESGEPVTLKFLRIGNDAAEADYWKALIADFESKNTNIKIEYDDAAIGEPMETKLNSMFSAGMGPDLIGHGIMSVAARVEAGNYSAITSYFNNWEGKDDIMKSVLANGTYKDEVYGLAYSTTPFVFAYRTDLFEEAGLAAPPATWDELAEYARKLTVKEKNVITRAGFAFPMSAGNFVEFDVFTFTNGGTYFDKDLNPTFDTPEKAEAFEFLKSFIGEVNIPYNSNEVNPFINGNAAMTLINNVALTPMLKNPDFEGKVAIALPPKKTTSATFSGCNMLFIGSTCKNPDEAFMFIEQALSKDEVLNRAKVLNIPVTRSSQVEAFKALDPLNAVRAECVSVGIGMPRTTWAAAFQRIRNETVQAVLYGDTAAAKALTDAQAALLDEIAG